MHPIVWRYVGTPIATMLLALLFPLRSEISPSIPTFLEKGTEAHLDKVVVSGDRVEKFLTSVRFPERSGANLLSNNSKIS